MKNKLSTYTLYKKPKDYPDHYVIVRWDISQESKSPLRVGVIFKSKTEEIALNWFKRRRLIPVGRTDSDDKNILGTWV